MAKSVEEKVEEYYKGYLDRLGVEHYGKTEGMRKKIVDMTTAMLGTVPIHDAVGFYDKE